MLNKHSKIEKNSILLLVCVVIAISVGGLIEIVPLFRVETTIEPIKGIRPYTPLELAGQDIYIREGCYGCHSQQIRPLRDEVERYGHYSLAAESMYDHPFQWGSKRTGPDLARVGGKYSDDWHVGHMINPQEFVPESIMPSYSAMESRDANLVDIGAHLATLKLVGVPYTDSMIENAYDDAMTQAQEGNSESESALFERYGKNINIRNFDGKKGVVSELDAIIAYLQVLGTMANLKDYDPDILIKETSPE
ncbi:MAG: cytochrome-c oxidase, cbb3-type subunit II [Candidatus Thioglobus sp.]|jgi:cytochrome c oxidase cbb3-type subunit II|nr:cytochrome-c oxidase, cbb3-type subunit II [Candidatus Thioglobus sp.]